MTITKESILRRAKELQEQADKLRSDLSATLGALQDCGYWLSQLEKQDADLSKAPETRD